MLDDKNVFTNKQILNTNIIKKEVNTVINCALGILGSLCAFEDIVLIKPS